MSKHTPAPWKAGSKSVSAPETEERLALDVRIFGGNNDDNRANARLIAAAPELLDALLVADEQLEFEGYDPEGPTRSIILAAIRKATGE